MSIIRSVKNVTKGYSTVQVKVRNATSNDVWGPTSTDMADIAMMTLNNSIDFYEIMDMLDKRLNDKGKNWRHVLKALKVLEYCLHEGSELVVSWARKNVSIIRTLRDFRYTDGDGRDLGQNIRISAQVLVSLIMDDEKMRQARARASSWLTRVIDLDLVNQGSPAAPYAPIPEPQHDMVGPHIPYGDYYNDDDPELRLALEVSKKEDERRQRALAKLPECESSRICGPTCVFKGLKQVAWDNSLAKSIDRISKIGHPLTVVSPNNVTQEGPYKPLRRWQTRLVQITPTSDDIPKCSLTTVEFIDMQGVGISGTDDTVTYSAISYVWGKQEDDCTILCNDCPVQVSRNLAKFLAHLSRSKLADSGSQYYWCDALCIDQQNPTEKAFQVRNMLRIFEKADRVLGWLRPRDTLETLNGVPLLYATLSYQMLQNEDIQHHEEQCTQNLARAQQYLREICDDSFFQRIWIRQEMFAAQSINLFLGGQKGPTAAQFDDMVVNLFEWLSISDANPARKALQSTDPLMDNRFGVDPRFQTMCRHFQNNGTDRHEYRPPAGRRRYSVHWLCTLQDGASFHVTDPRDRVYGILGIISSTTTRLYVEDRPDIKIQNLPIDYDKTVSEVYQDVVRFLVDTDRNLDCLTVFEDRRHPSSEFPSWVTDWRRDVPRSFIGVDADPVENRAKFGLAPKQIDLQPGELHVEGVRYFSVNNLTAIKSWPSEMLKASTGANPHILFNTIGWMDEAIADFAPLYAQCNLRENLKEKEAIFHKQLLNLDGDYLLGNQMLYMPRTTMLDDIVVSLNSARCLFVIRAVPAREDRFKLVGPVLGHLAALDYTKGAKFDELCRQYEQAWFLFEGTLSNAPLVVVESFVLV